jgi:hypothetical protein
MKSKNIITKISNIESVCEKYIPVTWDVLIYA